MTKTRETLFDAPVTKPKRPARRKRASPASDTVATIDQFGPVVMLPPAKEDVAKGDIVPASAVVPRSSPDGAAASPHDMTLEVLKTIERIAANPQVDAEKLGSILAMQERIMDRQARAAFDAAFTEMQPKLPEITKDGRIIVKAKDARGERTGPEIQNTPYAKWEKIVPIIKPILHEHGFSLSHRSSTAPDGKLRVTAVLRGHGFTDDSCYLDMVADTTGSKNPAQGTASALSYAKRHTGCSVLNIVTKDEDDDGKGSGRPIVVGEPITPEQLEELVTFAVAVECSAPKLIKHMNETKPRNHPMVDRLDDLPASRFREALDSLRRYDENKKSAEKGNKK